MKYYQLFYNASECGLSGTPGFGVRSATEGIPQEYIDAVVAEESLLSYQSGDFEIPTNDIFAHPERIVEYPRTYYSRKLPLPDGRAVYAVGRIVCACFDFPFYHSGNLTRTGNFVNHVYLFEEKPSPEVFDLLFEEPESSSARFLPRDWSPRTNNPEMTGLMIGKPESIPVEEKPFRSAHQGICEKAYTLFFQYLSLRNNGRPLVVRTKAAEVGGIVAGFMRLLPASLAQDVTFVTNHQENGLAKGVKITFVNEFYPNQIYTTTCEYVDLLEGEIAPTALEKVYRQSLVAADVSGDVSARSILSEWICSEVASRNVSKPQDFNLALFNYAHHPELFTYEQLEGIDGLISELSSLIGRDEAKAARLNTVLSERFAHAASAPDFKKVIDLSEKCRNGGIPVSAATETARQVMTVHSLTDMESLCNYLSTVGEMLYGKYADTSKLPRMGDVLPEIVSGKLSLDQKKKLLLYLEKDPQKRVACYVHEIRRAPAEVGSYQSLLDWDKAEADRVNWLNELKDSYDVDAIAQLLFNQIQRQPRENKEKLSLLADLSAKNAAFKSLVKKNAGAIYTSACTAFENSVHPAAFKETLAFIEEKVRPFIKDEKSVTRRFDMLCQIMKGDFQDVRNPEDYWDLAVKMGAKESQQKLLDKCFSSFGEKERIYGFVDTLMAGGMGNEEIIDHVVRQTKSKDSKIYFWRALKKKGGYSGYDSIYNLGKRLNLSEDDIANVFRNYFKAEYKAHKREEAMKKFKGFIRKKPVWISGIVLLLAVIGLVLFLTLGKRKAEDTNSNPGSQFERKDDSADSLQIPSDSLRTPPDSLNTVGMPVDSTANQ